MFKSQQFSLIRSFAFSNIKLFFEMLSLYKNVVTLKLAFSSHQQGALLWLVFNIKESSYFSTIIVPTATVFF